MGRPTQLSSFHLHLHHKHLALSLSLSVATWIFGHVTLESSKSRSPLKPAESIRKLWFSVAKWMTVSFCSGIHLFGPTNFTANGRKNIYPEGNIKRPLGTVSPWAMEVSRYRQKPPMLNSSFFVRLHSFPSTQFPVLSCPHLSASAVRVHLDGVKMGQTGGGTT